MIGAINALPPDAPPEQTVGRALFRQHPSRSPEERAKIIDDTRPGARAFKGSS